MGEFNRFMDKVDKVLTVCTKPFVGQPEQPQPKQPAQTEPKPRAMPVREVRHTEYSYSPMPSGRALRITPRTPRLR